MNIRINSINYKHDYINNSYKIASYHIFDETKIDAVVTFVDGCAIESKIKEYFK